MAIININGVQLSFPDLITGGDAELPVLNGGVQKIIDSLRSLPFPRCITDAVQLNQGTFTISYTATATPATVGEDVGKVHKGKQGGGYWVKNRIASYEVAIDYHQNGKDYRLFDLVFTNSPLNSSKTQLEKAQQHEHKNAKEEKQCQANQQNGILLGIFLETSWQMPGSCTLKNNYLAIVTDQLLTAVAVPPPAYSAELVAMHGHESPVVLAPAVVLQEVSDNKVLMEQLAAAQQEIKALREQLAVDKLTFGTIQQTLTPAQGTIIAMHRAKGLKYNKKLEEEGQDRTSKQDEKIKSLGGLVGSMATVQKLLKPAV